mmetsp:Transcript_0/g.2  ORF Transcript_0/g.2 Transcript_0/m.2 type:complete len:99 (-) Transcript_0:336-632(-)
MNVQVLCLITLESLAETYEHWLLQIYFDMERVILTKEPHSLLLHGIVTLEQQHHARSPANRSIIFRLQLTLIPCKTTHYIELSADGKWSWRAFNETVP